MAQGTIKKIVNDKGFGFISGDRGDVFFHFTAVAGEGFDALQVGQAVEYTVDESAAGKPGSKGPRAASVKPL